MIENNKEVVDEVVPVPKAKKPRTEKQLAATAKLLENNKMKRELLKKHKEEEKLKKEKEAPPKEPEPVPAPEPVPEPVKEPEPEPEPEPIEIDTPKQKRVYKKRVVKEDSKPKYIPPPIPIEYSESSESSSDEEQPQKPQRLARRFRLH